MSSFSKTNRVWLIVMAVLALIISVYPIVFAFVPGADGLFRSKAATLLASGWYKPIFYTHIGFGGIALLAGSTQFFKNLRQKRLNLHRTLGKIYVISALLSGVTGLIVASYATGGWISIAGFTLLAIGWLYFTVMAYRAIKNGAITTHQKWMMRSYALCFGAVTLRIYLGLGAAMGFAFNDYYPYLAWISWVPNLLFVEYRIKKTQL